MEDALNARYGHLLPGMAEGVVDFDPVAQQSRFVRFARQPLYPFLSNPKLSTGAALFWAEQLFLFFSYLFFSYLRRTVPFLTNYSRELFQYCSLLFRLH